MKRYRNQDTIKNIQSILNLKQECIVLRSETVIAYNLEPEIYSFRVLEQFYEAVQKSGYDKKYPIHIKLETGMHRLEIGNCDCLQPGAGNIQLQGTGTVL